MYTLESLLHLGNPTAEQSSILKYMLDKGFKSCKLNSKGIRSFSYK
jgi:hypothetical protein